MKKILFAFCLVTGVSVGSIKADSPLTSTYFASSYYEYAIVSKAEVSRTVDDEVAAYLLDKNNPIDVKAAVINAIGWSYDGNGNAKKFREYLAAAHNTTTAQLNLSDLRSDELMCLGYLTGMDDYFQVDDAINMMQMAADKKKSSFTIHMLLAMLQAQKAMDTDFCKVWTLTSAVLNDTSLKRDIKTAAIQAVVDYMILYKSSCTESYSY